MNGVTGEKNTTAAPEALGPQCDTGGPVAVAQNLDVEICAAGKAHPARDRGIIERAALGQARPVQKFILAIE